MVEKELNTLPLSAYGGQRIDCVCGQTHSIMTENIAFGAKSSCGLKYAVERIIPPGSAVFFVADEFGSQILPLMRRYISKLGYRASDYEIGDDDSFESLSSFVNLSAVVLSSKERLSEKSYASKQSTLLNTESDSNGKELYDTDFLGNDTALKEEPIPSPSFSKIQGDKNATALETAGRCDKNNFCDSLEGISSILDDITGDGATQIQPLVSQRQYSSSPPYKNIFQNQNNTLASVLGCSEDIRLVIGTGGGEAAELSKLLAAELNVPLIILATAVDYPFYLAPFVVMGNVPKILPCPPPVALIADTDWLTGDLISDCATAAGFGELASKLIALFDRKVSSLIKSEHHCPFVTEQTLALIDFCTEKLENTYLRPFEQAALILEYNIRFSALLQLNCDYSLISGGEAQTESCLELLLKNEERQLRRRGENTFIIASVLSKVYSNTLERLDDIGFVPPPDNNLRIEAGEKYLGVSPSELLYRLKKFSPSTLKIENYKLREFCRELIGTIQSYDKKLARASKIFKRLYNDCGYSLLGYLDHNDLSLCIALAPDFRESFTLLTQMKNMGLLDRYI